MKASRSKKTVSEMVSAETGSAMVIAMLIMALLLGFTALAISRTNSETVASANDAAESRAYEASHASLEVMTRNFTKIFETKLNPDPTDITRVEGQTPPGFDDYTFTQDIRQTDDTSSVIMTEGQFQGLTALRDGWELLSATENTNNGVEVTLSRRFLNNRIPIFQFGIFYDDDLEFHPGPRFDFGGRVHSNGSLFLQAGTRLNFSSKVTTRRHVFTDVSKNGSPWTNWNDEIFIKDASGIYRQLQFNMGSVLNTVVNGAAVSGDPLPTAYPNANWDTSSALFQGNLLAYQRPLELPLKLNSDITGQNLDLVELLKRGKSVGDVYNDGTGTVLAPNVVAVTTSTDDDIVTASERYANKTGIRIHLADSQTRLPGCAAAVSGTTRCGVRLDGAPDGLGSEPGVGASRGYTPKAMGGTGTYQATRINGERFFISGGKQQWIKIETVQYNATTQVYDTVDITEDILSLGVTEQAPAGVIRDAAYTTGQDGTDGRSIVRLQRFRISGADLPDSTYITNNYVVPANFSGTTLFCSSATRTAQDNGTFAPAGFTSDHLDHFKTATVGVAAGNSGCIVPFPINIFDTREGLYNETTATFDPDTAYGMNGTRRRVPWAGVMSMVEIDVRNLKRFMDGDFNGGAGQGALPSTGTQFSNANSRALRSTDIPNANGIVLYVSDRRGDFDFDGEYDMEDVFGGNDGIMQPGEDLQRTGQLGFGVLSADYTNEAVRYRGSAWFGSSWNQFVEGDIAATFEHKFYRRGVRLVNGTTLPGIYDPASPTTTRGFTVASENAVYVQGNYNADGTITGSYGTPTACTQYNPVNHVPASIASDALYILSTSWNDAQSFTSPYDTNPSRMAGATTARFAILSGDTISGLIGTGPHQGGNDLRMNGGVHNFKRFLEDWGGVRLNYCGSLINLFNSHNNNGTYKNGAGKVYNPPNRDWVFDTSFLDVNRIPPGTPFFQAIQVTGFERRN